MVHTRRWCRSEVASTTELGAMLAEQVFTLCSCFVVTGHEGTLFVNDSFTENGAQEYAVLRSLGGKLVQVESITFGWCSAVQAVEYVERAVRGAYDATPLCVVTPCVERPREHGQCQHCR